MLKVVCRAAVLALALLFPAAPMAGEVRVAVASNFIAPAQDIAVAFEAQTGHVALMSFGSSGKLLAQIGQGAPFNVFLSADSRRPQDAVAAGLAIADSAFTYALGRLVLWSADPALVDAGGEVLAGGAFAHIAIANPDSAPYGAAAVEAMQRLGVYSDLSDRLVTGDSIAQTFQFVQSENAELGFVAASQVADAGGSVWVVPEDLYAPIAQDAVLLTSAEHSQPAVAFLAFLRSAEAATIIRRHGYGLSGD